ncbi:MAG: mechanosensitive ion channel [Caulobacter sp.]|nr:mechanosensitive ion channel [Caulobacter sp.]
MQWLSEQAAAAWLSTLARLASPATYAQLAIVVLAAGLAWLIAAFLGGRVKAFRTRLAPDAFQDMDAMLSGLRRLLPPVTLAIVLSLAKSLSADAVGESWLVQAAQGAALIYLIYSFISQLVRNPAVIFIFAWIGIPVSLLYMAGWLDDITRYLDSVSVDVGNIKITLYAVIRTVFFGALLFWLGRASNNAGQRIIRHRTMLDASAREVVAKLFEISVYGFTLLLLFNVMGVDLTALAVFGGALGVGLGVGLQPIASNFISGLIILLDRSITIGDYIELEDGRAGTLRDLTIRSATLETFDGKDIMVPNERFITTAFVNWTHNNQKQRYSLNFQVAYKTDLDKLFEIVREVVRSHPKVLSGDDLPLAERPDAEIEKFGDSGIDILVEFWMDGIDDGDNRVGADLLLMIWTALKANDIEIPFPQREVKVLGGPKAS